MCTGIPWSDKPDRSPCGARRWTWDHSVSAPMGEVLSITMAGPFSGWATRSGNWCARFTLAEAEDHPPEPGRQRVYHDPGHAHRRGRRHAAQLGRRRPLAGRTIRRRPTRPISSTSTPSSIWPAGTGWSSCWVSITRCRWTASRRTRRGAMRAGSPAATGTCPTSMWSMYPRAEPSLRARLPGAGRGPPGRGWRRAPDHRPPRSIPRLVERPLAREPWLAFHSIQTCKDVGLIYPMVRQDCALEPAKPVVMAEGAYEGGTRIWL